MLPGLRRPRCTPPPAHLCVSRGSGTSCFVAPGPLRGGARAVARRRLDTLLPAAVRCVGPRPRGPIAGPGVSRGGAVGGGSSPGLWGSRVECISGAVEEGGGRLAWGPAARADPACPAGMEAAPGPGQKVAAPSRAALELLALLGGCRPTRDPAPAGCCVLAGCRHADTRHGSTLSCRATPPPRRRACWETGSGRGGGAGRGLGAGQAAPPSMHRGSVGVWGVGSLRGRIFPLGKLRQGAGWCGQDRDPGDHPLAMAEPSSSPSRAGGGVSGQPTTPGGPMPRSGTSSPSPRRASVSPGGAVP